MTYGRGPGNCVDKDLNLVPFGISYTIKTNPGLIKGLYMLRHQEKRFYLRIRELISELREAKREV